MNNIAVQNKGKLLVKATEKSMWIIKAKNSHGIISQEINITKEHQDQLNIQEFYNLVNEFSEQIEFLKHECRKVTYQKKVLEEDMKRLHMKEDIAIIKLKFISENENLGISFCEIFSINKAIDEIVKSLYPKNRLRILKIKTGSIEEFLAGSISQIITISGILFAVSKGLLHIIKERKTIKKIEYENELKKREIKQKKQLINKERQKKKNIERLLAKNKPELVKILEEMDEDFIDYILQNFDFNPLEKLEANSIKNAINSAKNLHKEYSLKEMIVETIENNISK